MFANPLGLLALLAMPVLVAIHFLQKKSISLPISTLFLLERTQREATAGRRFERFIPSLPLWMQLLATCILAWLLSEPRFTRENSVQRVAVVVDSSASMSVFKQEAISKVEALLPDLQGQASRLELTLLSSIPNSEPLYTGSSTFDFMKAFTHFQPTGGMIDPSFALRLARSILSNDGTLIYLTDTPTEALPYDAKLLAVGKSIDNVGFTGVRFIEEQGQQIWQASIRNYGKYAAKRKWTLKSENSATTPREIEIPARSVVNIQAAFPEQTERVQIELTPDLFTIDDTMPMVAPVPKALKLFTATSPAFRDLVEKLLRSLASTYATENASEADLTISSYDPLDPLLPMSNSILFVEDPSSVGKYLKGGILAETHPLMDGIHWQSLLVRETLELPRRNTDCVLLWQEKRPLIFLREEQGIRSLCFNFDLRLSNAPQQPAFIVLLHRFAELLRSEKISYHSLNLELGQPIHVSTNPQLPTDAIAQDLTGKTIATPPRGTAPTSPSFFTITQNKQTILNAAVHFADTREADFTACESKDLSLASQADIISIQTKKDPFSRIWMLILLLALLTAWCYTASDLKKENLTSNAAK